MIPDYMIFADQVESELRLLADPKRKEGEYRYFKETINNLGVTFPMIQRVEKRMCKGVASEISLDQAMELCETLLERRIHEVTLFGLLFISRFADEMGWKELDRCEEWLRRDFCDNWAATDNLCPHTVSSIVDNHPDLAYQVKGWAVSSNRWLRRGSAVTFVLLARKGKFLDICYEIAENLFADREDDLVQKGNGWMLRECGITDPDRLAEFLLKNGPCIPRTTLRYAIEKFSPEHRKYLLAATRADIGRKLTHE